MKIDRLIGERFKETPSDVVLQSHAFLVRGGYIKSLSNGIFSLLPPSKRIINKIEAIIREEMDAIEGQEVLFPVVMPASLWQESGRYSSIGAEMVRFVDRNRSPYVLGMTHEEAAVHLVRDYANTYAKYPFMIYQIQTKFRDEARPRGGLIRVREFTMKDGYSFHTSKADLEQYYQRALQAYHTIFKRVGLPEVVAVQADSGIMGGNVSHEFMLLTGAGEDTIITCSSCDYKANREVATAVLGQERYAAEALEELLTPGIKTLEALSSFLKKPLSQLCKAVVYEADEQLVVVFVRGDREVNEGKLSKHLGVKVGPAKIEVAMAAGLTLGFVGPKGVPATVKCLFDKSLQGLDSLVVGANKVDYHLTGFNLEAELGSITYHDFINVADGDLCPVCGASIQLKRGVEVGNIFQLDNKYSKIMNMNYLDEQGQAQIPLMGCYGIGVGRLLASVCEVKHDAYGPIWPYAIAPWQVHLCVLNNKEVSLKTVADDLYNKLQQRYEVLYDDRDLRPGAMFADADLLGIPIRLVISPKNHEQGVVELVSRDKTIKQHLPYEQLLSGLEQVIQQLIGVK